jgi:hypothetical protein
MNITMRLTLDGMIRALRWHGHVLRESYSGPLKDTGPIDREGRWEHVMQARDKREAKDEFRRE